MTTINKWISALGCALILAACGGSGGSGPGNQAPTIRIQPESNTLSAGHTMQVDVRLTHPDGSPAPNGTAVTLTTSNPQRAQVAPANDPGAMGSQATAGAGGGFANFLVSGRSQTGSVRLSASATFAGHSVSTNFDIEITAAEPGGRLTIAGNNRLPANTTGVPIFFGSPYISELTITYRNASGQPASVADGEMGVAISPVTRAAFSTLDDPETPDINEFFVLLGNGPVKSAAGQATIFVHSFDMPGTVVVTAEAQDASTGEIFATQFEIEIIDGPADGLPAEIFFDTGTAPLYTQGSGGPTSKSMNVHVLDSGHNPVPDPEGFNNLRLELASPVPPGARLVGTNAAGQSVSGQSISVATVGGIAGFALNSGTETGTARIIATADRADNNVDNGLQVALTEESSIMIGDGRLFSLRWDTPTVNAITIETISSRVDTDIECEEIGDTGVCVPSDPNGFYSLPVTVQGIDQAGNPVLSGTAISFGKIDAPLTQTVPRNFVFSGPHGDPQEGGTLFTVLNPPEGFLTSPGGPNEAVGPGDTVALFGHFVPGNREHEAVRFVQSVIDNTSLRVSEAFNPNSHTGTSVDDGPVIPWVVGRAECGAVEQTASLDHMGLATVRLTYPLSCVSRPMVLWAQGVRPGGTVAKTVADVSSGRMPGIAPAILSASPNQVSGNSTVTIRVCLSDALGAPFSDVFIRAAKIEGDGQAAIDGVPIGSTTTANATGPNGCVDTQLTTSGMIPDGEDIVVRFSALGAFDDVTAKPPGTALLIATPSSITHSSQTPINVNVRLRLTDTGGSPLAGIPLQGECPHEDVSITSGPGVTDAEGETTVTLRIDLASCEGETTTSCTFSTSTGNPTTTVNIRGVDLSESGVSPAPDCP